MSSLVAISEALADMVVSYHELNGQFIDQIHEEPSALEFMRYVAKNRPFVVRGGALHWPAVQRWSFKYLVEEMKDQYVNVAVTPYGNADSIVLDPDNDVKYFVKPYEASEPFNDFLRYVQSQELDGDMLSNVKYAQTQNDNLRGEYSPLFKDVDNDIAWCRVALGQEPDAINLWIGNSRSTTAMHRDNYENIYCQIIGQKQFVLISPIEVVSVKEECFPTATYAPARSRTNDVDLTGLPDAETRKLVIAPDEGNESVPCPTWDPDKPDNSECPRSPLMRVNLGPGDMLYLPAMWYHKVTQTCGNEGICCAVNYWYDMEFAGSLYCSSAFIRKTALALAQD